MPLEIERRFLVKDPSILDARQGRPIVQGYLVKASGAMSTRIRVSGALAWITLKSPRIGMMREEYEYPIPVGDALQIIERHCAGRVLHKTRYDVPQGGHVFEVDVFHGHLSGLVIAELELQTLPNEASGFLMLPDWLGTEVTGDHRYGNASLAQHGIPSNLPGRPWIHREHAIL